MFRPKKLILMVLVLFAGVVVSGCSKTFGITGVGGVISIGFAQPMTVTNLVSRQQVSFVDVVNPCDPSKVVLRLSLSEGGNIYPSSFCAALPYNFQLLAKGYLVQSPGDTQYVGYATTSVNRMYPPSAWNITGLWY
jgi:hypothetical protein